MKSASIGQLHLEDRKVPRYAQSFRDALQSLLTGTTYDRFTSQSTGMCQYSPTTLDLAPSRAQQVSHSS